MVKKINLAVIFGGQSGEHEVSLRSAAQVVEALDKNKYNIIPIAIKKSGQWLIGEVGQKYLKDNLEKAEQEGGIAEEKIESVQNKLPEKLPAIDLVLPILHGTYGEDGKIQGLLDTLGIPYVFSGTLASALAMHKRKTKIIAKAAGLKIAKDVVIIRDKKYNPEKIIVKLDLPIVIKPSELGSSVGMSIANSKEELEEGIKKSLEYGEETLLEKFIKGRELTVAILGGKKPKALPVIEIIPQVSGWFDYRAKYEIGGSKEICPAKIPDDICRKIQNYAKKVFRAVGCQDLARADFIWNEKDNKIYFLEINTIPGMTATSLAPQAAAAAGMDFPKFLDKLIQLAIKRQSKK